MTGGGFLRSLSQRLQRRRQSTCAAAAEEVQGEKVGAPPPPPAKLRDAPGTPRAKGRTPPAQAALDFDPKTHCQCKVLLLDGTHLDAPVARKALGQDVYERVLRHLDVEERDYFGLQFTDHYHVQHWLDPLKSVCKQMSIGPPYTLRLRVKFYSSEPSRLRDESTRYQFFLQLKGDVQSGQLECDESTAVELAGLALQSEFGDHSATEHHALFVSEFRFHPRQDEQMELAVLAHYRSDACRGLSPAQAELLYLDRAKWLHLYGVDMHAVEGRDGNQYRLGLTPTGLVVFDGHQKIGLFFWEKLQRLDFCQRKLTLVVEEDAQLVAGQVQLHTFVFNLSSHKACKHVWKCAVEHHAFFRLKYNQPQRAARAQLFRLGSTFKYRGRTEYESVHSQPARQRERTRGIERRPSQRYVPRMSHLERHRLRQPGAESVAPAADAPPPRGSTSVAAAQQNGDAPAPPRPTSSSIPVFERRKSTAGPTAAGPAHVTRIRITRQPGDTTNGVPTTTPAPVAGDGTKIPKYAGGAVSPTARSGAPG